MTNGIGLKKVPIDDSKKAWVMTRRPKVLNVDSEKKETVKNKKIKGLEEIEGVISSYPYPPERCAICCRPVSRWHEYRLCNNCKVELLTKGRHVESSIFKYRRPRIDTVQHKKPLLTAEKI